MTDSHDSYDKYEHRPRVLNTTQEEKDSDELEMLKDGRILFRPHTRHELSFKETVIDQHSIFDCVSPTVNGLLENLTPGSLLSRLFFKEFGFFLEGENGEDSFMRNGQWVYYPRRHHLVRFVSPAWHNMALLVRNSMLLRDKHFERSWKEIRFVFENTVVGVAGCSVGNGVAHAITRDMRPRRIKIADSKEYQVANANRVQLSYEDVGRHKAIVTAEQIHAIDPFIKISVFHEGVHRGNIDDFVSGNSARDEPPASIIVEETDDLETKLLIREKARQNKIPVVMVTDLGSAIQRDIRRFDKDQSISLSGCGVGDDELLERLRLWRNDLANQKRFWEFAFALIGEGCLGLEEFRRIVLKEEEPLFAGIPQLGSTVMAAGGIAAEAVSRIMLGFQLPERMLLNKHTGEVKIEGEWL